MAFKCNKELCKNTPIKMYKYENTIFYICSQHLQDFEKIDLVKITEKKSP